MKGIINVLKPPNMTSHDVVSVIRRKFNMKKVGHTGTLDPMAVGVLPICIGKATKIVEFIQNQKKTYRAEMTLGVITDTQDKWGKTLEKRDFNLSSYLIMDTIKSFTGEVKQIPPMFSALKHNGKKLYELAREGITVERKVRNIYIHSINVLDINRDKILFDVECSKGTYVRTLCHDIGESLGCGAHMSFLARLKSGNFTIEDTITIEEIKNLDLESIIEKHLYDVDYPLTNFPKVHVDESQFKKLLNGCTIESTYVKSDTNLNPHDLVLLYVSNKFLALGEFQSNFTIKIKKLFS